MKYKQLKKWRGLGKAFNVLSWENIISGAFGAWCAYQLSSLLPWLPWQLAYPPLIIAGIALTWPHEGRWLCTAVVMWGQYYLRRWLAPETLIIHSRDYYRRPAPTTGGVVSSAVVFDTGTSSRRGSMLPPGLRTLPAVNQPDHGPAMNGAGPHATERDHVSNVP